MQPADRDRRESGLTLKSLRRMCAVSIASESVTYTFSAALDSHRSSCVFMSALNFS